MHPELECFLPTTPRPLVPTTFEVILQGSDENLLIQIVQQCSSAFLDRAGNVSEAITRMFDCISKLSDDVG